MPRFLLQRRRNDNEEHKQTSVVSEADVVPSIPMVTYVDIDRNEPSQNGTPKYDSSNSTNTEDQVKFKTTTSINTLSFLMIFSPEHLSKFFFPDIYFKLLNNWEC